MNINDLFSTEKNDNLLINERNLASVNNDI